MTSRPTAGTRFQSYYGSTPGPGEGGQTLNNSRYLVRFDDICPSMNWKIWEVLERDLVRNQVRPILAVVPDNRDPMLMVDEPMPDFWDRVRRWQGMGYTIALHGYQHTYVNELPGLMKLTPHSEFVGLSYQEQEAKLTKALAIFAEQGVRADAFVAPSHSFDLTTLKVLSDLGVKVISDGLWPWPHADQYGTFWIPQQLWAFSPKPAGVWTVCCHHNGWTEKQVTAFGRNLSSYSDRMTDVATVMRTFAGRRLTLSDRVSALGNLLWFHRIKPPLGELWRRWNRPRASA